MRQIPSTGGLSAEVKQHAEAVKQNIEEMRGVVGSKMSKLNVSTATTSQIASKVNEIITLLQG